MLKKIAIGLAAIFVILQFFRPEKNLSDARTHDISTLYPMPQEVASILEVSCNDCHSNKTRYPWYSEIQPVAWWIEDHVNDGKRHLNYSTFTALPLARQYHKFEETVEVVEEKEMPMQEYTYLGLHAEAKLTDAQRTLLIDWAKAQMASMQALYPPDSLVRKRRQ